MNIARQQLIVTLELGISKQQVLGVTLDVLRFFQHLLLHGSQLLQVNLLVTIDLHFASQSALQDIFDVFLTFGRNIESQVSLNCG